MHQLNSVFRNAMREKEGAIALESREKRQEVVPHHFPSMDVKHISAQIVVHVYARGGGEE